MEVETSLNNLPEECLSHIITFTTPGDACRTAAVCKTFHMAADSDATWEGFLPLDYREIVSRSVSEVEFSSKKELFRRLSAAPLLIDGGTKTFWIDPHSSKSCYMVSPRELSIIWSANPLCWCWKPLLHSRFPQGVELIMVSWLQIEGQINSRILSPNTNYGAYLVFQIVSRAFGLGTLPCEVELQVGDCKTRRMVWLDRDDCKIAEGDEEVILDRGDGWLELELGEFNTKGGGEMGVKMGLRETEGEQLKGGLVIEGIELRPKKEKVVGCPCRNNSASGLGVDTMGVLSSVCFE